jgi:hypothetical protein
VLDPFDARAVHRDDIESNAKNGKISALLQQ